MGYSVYALLIFFKKFNFSASFRACLFIILIPAGVFAQIDVTAPLERSVFQRETNNFSDVTFSGSYSIPVDKIEIQATPVASNQGTPVTWTTLQDKPSGGAFSGTLRLAGGWYKIEVRGTKGGVAIGNIDVISRVGVGEVFVISGQSNAQGMVDHNVTTVAPPGAQDDRVNYVNYSNEIGNFTGDLPAPTFSHLNSTEDIMGLRGHGSWCWGILGDLLAQKLNVPIMFINTGWDGSSIRNWLESAQGKRTYSVYSSPQIIYPEKMPYANLQLSVKHYVKQYGMRAILWMQGETDNSPLNMSFNEYKSSLQSLISMLSTDANRRIPWVIARTSYVDGRPNPTIISAQNSVINDLPGVAYAGPQTDNLPVTRIDGTHFYGTANLTSLANAWNDVLSVNFFSTVNPASLTQEPKITSACAPNNTSVNLTLPDGFASYEWTREVNGSTQYSGDKSINVSAAGKYYGKVKDANGNTLRTQTMIISTGIKPGKPTILQSGAQQECADSSFTFSINPGNDIYNWYKQGTANSLIDGSSLTVSESGNYFVRTQNVFGCLSDNSDVASLTIRPQIPTPVINKVGPFTAEATINQTGLGEKYDWTLNQQLLTTSVTSTIRTRQNGTYSTRANVTFTLGSNLLTCYSPYSNDLEVITEGESDIVVFPNPGARDNVFVESREDIENAEIIVYDLYGRVVVSQVQDMFARVKILVKNLSTGKYIVRIKGANVDVKRQLIVL